MRWMRFGVTAALVCLASPGLAQELPELPVAPQQVPEPPEPPAATRTWYGWQTLIVLGSSVAVGALGVATASAGEGGRQFGAVAFALGGWGVFFGGPAVHWAHGHAGRGFATMGLSLGLSTAGMLVGAYVDRESPLRGLLVGAYVGLFCALVVDVAALAYDDVPPPSAARHGLRLAPDLRLSGRGGTLGVVGTF